jgi:hypothetical protein
MISYDDVAATRKTILELIDGGMTHIVLSFPRGYPEGVARWLADEIIVPVRAELAAG